MKLGLKVRVQRVVLLIIGMIIFSSAMADNNRSQIRYRAAQQIAVHDKVFEMNGFRFFGKYHIANADTYTTDKTSSRTIISFGKDSLATTKENWYGVFAAANSGDKSPTFKLVPFIRVASVNGSELTFMKAGEGVDNATKTQSYNWTESLNNVDILVINETIDNRKNGFSGRITKVTNSAETSMSLLDIGNIGPKDFLLPAPPNFESYRYLGSIYMDTHEVRNIADSGALVKSKMIELGVTNKITGSGLRKLTVGGYISPLATTIVIDAITHLQTTSGGTLAHYFGTDEFHVVQSTFYQKTTSTPDVVVEHGITIPFAFSQSIYLSTAGSLEDTRDYATFSVTGWLEP